MVPNINWNKCDGCGQCVEICPKKVLALKELSEDDYQKLKWYGKLKSKLQGRLKSKVIDESNCIGCKKCVGSCHEKAIL